MRRNWRGGNVDRDQNSLSSTTPRRRILITWAIPFLGYKAHVGSRGENFAISTLFGGEYRSGGRRRAGSTPELRKFRGHCWGRLRDRLQCRLKPGQHHSGRDAVIYPNVAWRGILARPHDCQEQYPSRKSWRRGKRGGDRKRADDQPDRRPTRGAPRQPGGPGRGNFFRPRAILSKIGATLSTGPISTEMGGGRGAQRLEERKHLIVEAGTGVGKEPWHS